MPDVLLTMFDGIYLESVIHHAGVDTLPQSPIRLGGKWSYSKILLGVGVISTFSNEPLSFKTWFTRVKEVREILIA